MLRALKGPKLFKKPCLVVVCALIFLAATYYTIQIGEPSFNQSSCPYSEPIDIVYTWVNGSDQQFIQEMHKYMQAKANTDSSKKRFEDKNELRFSLRSLEKFAPWINHVYLVTNGQIPYWLNLDYQKVTLITHDMIFKNSSNLPTFSSPAIESNLHRIPGLSKRFIYFNDDIFLGKPLYLEDLYSQSTGFSVFLAYALPNCAPRCPWLYVGDGQCDLSCNVRNCQFDAGDCIEQKARTWTKASDLSLMNTTQRTVNATTSTSENRFFHTGDTGPIARLVIEHNKKVLLQNKKLDRKRRNLAKLNPAYAEAMQFSKTIDGFLTSLQYTQRVFNRKFGLKMRYVPAHAPILIDRDIMQELERTFSREFEITEGNRFRHDDDMQFGFSYYYFLMSETTTKSTSEIFDDFDTDRSGSWSDREIRNLLTKLHKLPLTYETVDHFEAILMNCSELNTYPPVPTPAHERYVDSKLPTISKDLVVQCPMLDVLLSEKLGKVPKYPYKVIKNAETSWATFRMLISNITNVVHNLDEIRSKLTKFVCLNDNLMEWKLDENELIKALLYDFYLSLFPHPSQFEHPDHSRNRFLHMDQLGKWTHNHYVVKIILTLAIISLIFITLFNTLKRGCCKVLNEYFF
ncbi:N-acetylglucosamine-1-phosphotransferase subunits alpha/beta isoform X2 [Dendroctonus ponderosae]|uniref:N-acetylglucosamine-1-phosphotransferase subunits alpha/beta isoform X2 n=1 Tax=Dendroctonus ponderosae TaxID=77166 RepID=UPI002036492D|nr:N-acetylglucosamine-1-phosphotransferase subunits alpha/beta isoform X2 [Dendroctonus ponderosae]